MIVAVIAAAITLFILYLVLRVHERGATRRREMRETKRWSQYTQSLDRARCGRQRKDRL